VVGSTCVQWSTLPQARSRPSRRRYKPLSAVSLPVVQSRR
jgi:hypothetical protein